MNDIAKGSIIAGAIIVGGIILMKKAAVQEETGQTFGGSESSGYIEDSGGPMDLSKFMQPNVYNITYEYPALQPTSSTSLIETKKETSTDQTLMSAADTSVYNASTGGYINYDSMGQGMSSAEPTKKESITLAPSPYSTIKAPTSYDSLGQGMSMAEPIKKKKVMP